MPDLFDGFNELGDSILFGVSQDSAPARRFKYLLGQINALFMKTHGMVLDHIKAIEATDDLSVAQQHLDMLQIGALEDSFRGEGLCDMFEAFGHSLASLTDRSESLAEHVLPNPGFTMDFAQRLMNREREVATLYVYEIHALGDLVLQAGDLPQIKEAASRARQVLTNQIADFAVKAQKLI